MHLKSAGGRSQFAHLSKEGKKPGIKKSPKATCSPGEDYNVLLLVTEQTPLPCCGWLVLLGEKSSSPQNGDGQLQAKF